VSNANSNRTSVVGVGASAGGIDAFRGFFEHMPDGSGLAFVVILHLPADRPSLLADILGRFTPMRVVETVDGCPIAPDQVFVPPPGLALRLQDGRLYSHRPAAGEARETNPIDVFFDSMATALQEDAVGVVLSGTGSDGALGLKAIRAKGGLTLAQRMDSGAAQHGGMPASAIAAGVVDLVAPVETMAAHILNARDARRRAGSATPPSAVEVEAARLRVCQLLQKKVGHDFSGYKERILRRCPGTLRAWRATCRKWTCCSAIC
jgi:two-component system, chemotaxis family, CheB/CheR fusion protein